MSENLTDYHMNPLPLRSDAPNPYVPIIFMVIVVIIIAFIIYYWLTKE